MVRAGKALPEEDFQRSIEQARRTRRPCRGVGDPVEHCRAEARFKGLTHDEVNRRGCWRRDWSQGADGHFPKPHLAWQLCPAMHLVSNQQLAILPLLYLGIFVWSTSE